MSRLITTNPKYTKQNANQSCHILWWRHSDVSPTGVFKAFSGYNLVFSCRLSRLLVNRLTEPLVFSIIVSETVFIAILTYCVKPIFQAGVVRGFSSSVLWRTRFHRFYTELFPPAGCERDHYLHQGLCVLDCPESFFERKEQRECLRCHPDCAVCDGPRSTDCDACADPDAALHNGACLRTCPSHKYRDAVTGECQGIKPLHGSEWRMCSCDHNCFTFMLKSFSLHIKNSEGYFWEYDKRPNFLLSSLTSQLLELPSCIFPIILFCTRVCFLSLDRIKIATLFKQLTGSCQTLKTEQWCRRRFPGERHSALLLLFKNTKDGKFLPGKCCRRCPHLLLLTAAARSENFQLHCWTAEMKSGWFLIFNFIWSGHKLEKKWFI